MERIQAMTNANGTSERALRIRRVVGEIAFQTNILALNAALDAASAGEVRQGFLEGVVADTSILVAESLGRSACAAGLPVRTGPGRTAGPSHETRIGD
jgi:methyl-accepting chemotaxis protein